MDNILTNLSKEFVGKLAEGAVFLACGSKGSGKTSTVFAILRKMIEINAFSQYYLVIPNYWHEASCTYQWLTDYIKKKKDIQITIFDGYNKDIVAKRIIDQAHEEEKKGIKKSKLFILDDATNQSLFRLEKDKDLMSIIINARHLGPCSTIFVVHTIKGCLSGVIRDNLSFVMISDIASIKLLHDIHEMWFSVIISWQDFLKLYNEHVSRPHGILLLYNSKNKKVDLGMLEWPFIKISLLKNLASENKK